MGFNLAFRVRVDDDDDGAIIFNTLPSFRVVTGVTKVYRIFGNYSRNNFF